MDCTAIIMAIINGVVVIASIVLSYRSSYKASQESLVFQEKMAEQQRQADARLENIRHSYAKEKDDYLHKYSLEDLRARHNNELESRLADRQIDLIGKLAGLCPAANDKMPNAHIRHAFSLTVELMACCRFNSELYSKASDLLAFIQPELGSAKGISADAWSKQLSVLTSSSAPGDPSESESGESSES